MARTLLVILALLLSGLTTAFFHFFGDQHRAEPNGAVRELKQTTFSDDNAVDETENIDRIEVPANAATAASPDLVISTPKASRIIEPIETRRPGKNGVRLSVEVDGVPHEEIEVGQIKMRVLGLGGRFDERLIDFQVPYCDLSLGDDDYALFIDHLVVAGETIDVMTESAWFERDAVFKSGFQLRLQIGPRRELEVVDARTGQSIAQIELYREKPLPFSSYDGRVEQSAIWLAGPSPFRWRRPPERTAARYVGAPGYQAQRIQNHGRVELAPAGQLELNIALDPDDPVVAKARLNLHLKTAPDAKGERYGLVHWRPDYTGADHRRISIDRLAAGEYLVEVRSEFDSLISSRWVSITAGKTTAVWFQRGIERFKSESRERLVAVHLPPGWCRNLPNLISGHLTPYESGQSLSAGGPEPRTFLARFPERPEFSDVVFLNCSWQPNGDYELRVFDQTFMIHFDSELDGPLHLDYPPEAWGRLRIEDSRGQVLDGQLIEIKTPIWGKIDYRVEEQCFYLPTDCPELKLTQFSARGRVLRQLSLPADVFAGPGIATYQIADLYSLEISFVDSDDAPGGDWPWWLNSENFVLLSPEGHETEFRARECLANGLRFWLDQPGSYQLEIRKNCTVEGAKRVKVAIKAGHEAKHEFRILSHHQ